MSWLSRLFGNKTNDAPAEAAAEDHAGFRIVPTPIKDGGQYRISARIEKVVDGQVKVHELIRADTMASRDEAVTASVNKARQMIDEQGDRIFAPRG